MLSQQKHVHKVLMLLLVIGLVASNLIGAPPAAQSHPASTSSDWSMYLGDPSRSGANLAETSITPATAPYLAYSWKFTTGAPVFAAPLVVNGVLYIGS